jgi:hypothetical protein
LPWQRYAADVIGERTPDGRYRYPIVVVTVPRQCGKTTWALDVALGRCLEQPDYRAAYTAQTGHVTTERMGDRFLELADGPLAPRARIRRSAGTERVTFPGRSYVKAFPPKAGALRSSALDLVIVDEAQEHGTVLGEQLDLTILPTFTTRRRRQLILVGTAGTDASDYLRRYLTSAREGVPGFAILEWGFADDDDPDDEATWVRTHPGLGPLTDLDALRGARAAMGAAGFSREFGNRWTSTADRVIDPTAWAAVQLPPETPRPTGPLCFSLDVAADRGSAAIAVATPGRYVELVDNRPGLEWLIPRCLELHAAYPGAGWAADRFGSAGPTVDALERAGVALVVMKAGDVANAAAATLDAIVDGSLTVYPSPALTETVEGAAQRPLGDSGGFAWARRLAAAPVAPLVAISHALWGAHHLAPEPPRPVAAAL